VLNAQTKINMHVCVCVCGGGGVRGCIERVNESNRQHVTWWGGP
jgi:hypothetical protein